MPHHPPAAKKTHVDGAKADGKHESFNLKGVDKKLAATILDELVDRYVHKYMYAGYAKI